MSGQITMTTLAPGQSPGQLLSHQQKVPVPVQMMNKVIPPGNIQNSGQIRSFKGQHIQLQGRGGPILVNPNQQPVVSKVSSIQPVVSKVNTININPQVQWTVKPIVPVKGHDGKSGQSLITIQNPGKPMQTVLNKPITVSPSGQARLPTYAQAVQQVTAPKPLLGPSNLGNRQPGNVVNSNQSSSNMVVNITSPGMPNRLNICGASQGQPSQSQGQPVYTLSNQVMNNNKVVNISPQMIGNSVTGSSTLNIPFSIGNRVMLPVSNSNMSGVNRQPVTVPVSSITLPIVTSGHQGKQIMLTSKMQSPIQMLTTPPPGSIILTANGGIHGVSGTSSAVSSSDRISQGNPVVSTSDKMFCVTPVVTNVTPVVTLINKPITTVNKISSENPTKNTTKVLSGTQSQLVVSTSNTTKVLSSGTQQTPPVVSNTTNSTKVLSSGTQQSSSVVSTLDGDVVATRSNIDVSTTDDKNIKKSNNKSQEVMDKIDTNANKHENNSKTILTSDKLVDKGTALTKSYCDVINTAIVSKVTNNNNIEELQVKGEVKVESIEESEGIETVSNEDKSKNKHSDDFDAVSAMQWEGGIGSLEGSDLKVSTCALRFDH